MIACVRTVNAALEQVGRLEAVRKGDLRSGDRLLVSTENSVYSIRVHGDATYSISGGWFDNQGLSPVRMSIAGCTWGGTVIKCDILAARGLRLEFGNRVVTSPIREVRVLRDEGLDLGRFAPMDSRALFAACYGSDTHRT